MKAFFGFGFVVLGLWWGMGGAFAQELVSSDVEVEGDSSRYVVASIEIEGNSRTKRWVIERELTFARGDVVGRADFEESVQRLRNTGLFRAVEYEVVETSGGVASPGLGVVRISLDERWTLLPAGRIGFGGGVTHLMVGASDANLFGSFLQLGGQFSRTGPANSFVLWFSDPRFLNQRLALTVDAGLSNRQVLFYEPDGEINGGFLQTSKSIDLALEKEWRWWWRTSARVGVKQDSFSYTLISDVQRERQEEKAGLPGGETGLVLGISSRWGRLNLNNYRVDGVQFRLQWLQTIHVPELAAAASQVDARLLGFVTLPFKSTLAVRLNLGLSRHSQEHQAYFLGGLDAVRGFENQRFRGAFFWLGNVELRVPSIDTRWLAVQHVVFMDSLGVADDAFDLWGLSAASVGVGLRVMSPKVHGFVARIGYAFNLYGGSGAPLSLGGGQFF